MSAPITRRGNFLVVSFLLLLCILLERFFIAPFFPIIEEGQEPFAMLTDLWIKHRDWVFEPIHYSSLDALVAALDKEIIGPAEIRCDELVIRKAEKMKGRHV